ncbi:calmodulin-like isoform X2 [Teleopsis dalmanni]|uniref:calmodulin-like isoform X2 n=1 Tax=Teleopsis dalmanni TaxID=139649 RepID=UPI0018CE953D|nr:calmodulin-like isoform X2 [Teleopsis dalmanni]
MTDGDGFLTIDELKTVLSYTGDGFTEEQIDFLVEGIATSSDGKINYETFVVVMSTDINECDKDNSTTSSEDQ